MLRAAGFPLLLAAALLTGCTADGDPFPPVADGIERPDDLIDLTGMAVVEIEVGDNVFRTRHFRVDPGTEIVFINTGNNQHNVEAAADGAFTKITDATLDEGPASLILDVPGDYPFFCSIHGSATRGQTGYVVVGRG